MSDAYDAQQAPSGSQSDKLLGDFPSQEELKEAHVRLLYTHAQTVEDMDSTIRSLGEERDAATLEAGASREEICVLKQQKLQLVNDEDLVSI
jgi:hypothetical protein